MFDDSKEQYLHWQQKMKTHTWFRKWWQFWSNYSGVLFVFAFLYLVPSSIFWDVLGLSVISFLLTRGVIINLINYYYKRERPYQAYIFTPLTSRFFSLQTNYHNSFPSRHIGTLSSITWVFVVLLPPIGWGLMAVTFLTAVARIILGFHYRSDVVVGFVIGLITAYFSLQIWSLFIFT
jgi:undecaprenyl-diphosphatase